MEECRVLNLPLEDRLLLGRVLTTRAVSSAKAMRDAQVVKEDFIDFQAVCME